mgnify:CR=1 FL=1
MELLHLLLFASLLGPTPRLTAPTACAVDNGPRPLRSRIASTLTAPVRWSRSERAVAPELDLVRIRADFPILAREIKGKKSRVFRPEFHIDLPGDEW